MGAATVATRCCFPKPIEGARRETYFGAQMAARDGRIVVGARGEDAVYVLH